MIAAELPVRKALHQGRQIAPGKRFFRGGQSGRAAKGEREFARRHRPEIAWRKTQQAKSRGYRVIPREGSWRSRIRYFPGVPLPSAG
jgi:hypothetical protein